MSVGFAKPRNPEQHSRALIVTVQRPDDSHAHRLRSLYASDSLKTVAPRNVTATRRRATKYPTSSCKPPYRSLGYLVAIEVVAGRDATLGLNPKNSRRELRGRLGNLVNDPRYGELGEIIFVVGPSLQPSRA